MNLGVSKYYPRWDAQIYISTFRWGKSPNDCNVSFSTNWCKKPTYTHQKCLHFLFESHSRRTKWNIYDVRAKNYFPLFLFIPPFRFGSPALFNGLLQFNCSSFHFQASLPKVLFLNDIVHSKQWQQLAQEKGIQNILNRSPQKKKMFSWENYGYITVASVHVFRESHINIFLLV